MRETNRPDPNYALADCDHAVEVGQCVYVSGSAAFPKICVSRASWTSYDTMPAIGIVVAKNSQTEAIVQLGGLVYGVFGGLTPGATYFVGPDGEITQDLPVAGGFLQVIGEALSSSILRLKPGELVRIYKL